MASAYSLQANGLSLFCSSMSTHVCFLAGFTEVSAQEEACYVVLMQQHCHYRNNRSNCILTRFELCALCRCCLLLGKGSTSRCRRNLQNKLFNQTTMILNTKHRSFVRKTHTCWPLTPQQLSSKTAKVSRDTSCNKQC